MAGDALNRGDRHVGGGEHQHMFACTPSNVPGPTSTSRVPSRYTTLAYSITVLTCPY